MKGQSPRPLDSPDAEEGLPDCIPQSHNLELGVEAKDKPGSQATPSHHHHTAVGEAVAAGAARPPPSPITSLTGQPWASAPNPDSGDITVPKLRRVSLRLMRSDSKCSINIPW